MGSTSTAVVFLICSCWTMHTVLSSHDQKPFEIVNKTCTKEVQNTYAELETYQDTCYKTVKKCRLLNILCTYRTEGQLCTKTHYVQKVKITTEDACCPGYLPLPEGNQCVRGCKDGLYGKTCSETCYCPDFAYPGCHIDTGDCFCPPGLTGKDCTEECPDGFFGDDCHEQCACKNNNYCDKKVGACICTQPGWTGTLCEKECDDGWYGADCRSSCTCSGKDNFVCDRVTGECSCDTGYMPPDCKQVCPFGYYGSLCKLQCSCHDSTCHHVTGNCICSNPGYTGTFCDQECSPGTYGIACSYTCSCSSLQTCDKKTGECSCIQPGRIGYFCNQVCPEGKFGIGCKEDCNCSSKESCDPKDGNCKCKEPGVWGPDCSNVCPKNTFGINCESICKCSDRQNCDHKTGKCTCKNLTFNCTGCECNKSGTENCVTDCLPCSYTPQDEQCMILPSPTLCKINEGVCLCKPGRKGATCNEVCSDGYYGRYCGKKCNCPEDHSCDGATGDCIRKDQQNIQQQNATEDILYIALLASAGGAVLFILCLVCIIVITVRRRRTQRPITEVHHRTYHKEDNGGFEDDYINYDSVMPVTNHLALPDKEGEKSSVKLIKSKKRPSVQGENCTYPSTDIYAIVAKEIDKHRQVYAHDETPNLDRKSHEKMNEFQNADQDAIDLDEETVKNDSKEN